MTDIDIEQIRARLNRADVRILLAEVERLRAARDAHRAMQAAYRVERDAKGRTLRGAELRKARWGR